MTSYQDSELESFLVSHHGRVDCVVVGSGVGGLTSASLLAQAGLTVIVFERAKQSGGATHGFSEHGFNFEMGLQDVGSEVWKGTQAKEPFAHVLATATQNKLEWNPFQEASYRVFIGDEEFVVRPSWKEFREDLVARFPKEEKAIDMFYDKIMQTRTHAVGYLLSKLPARKGPANLKRQISEKLGMTHDAKGISGAKLFSQEAHQTVDQVLDTITKDQDLRYLLTFLWSKCGLPPRVASWGSFALVVGQFFDGVAYPTGGAISIEKALTEVIVKHGGKVYVDAPVESISVEKNTCVGVVMKSGRVVKADKVISAIGAANTFERLIPSSMSDFVRTPALALKDLKWSSYTVLQLFFGFEGDSKSLGLDTASYWFLPGGQSTPDHTENAVRYFLDTSFKEDFPYVHVSFPSAKDPSNPKSTAVVFAAAHYDWFKGMTTEDIQNVADEIVSRLSQKMYEKFPQLKDKVKFAELATPLSVEFHLGASRGAPLGLGATPSRFEQAWLRPQTPVKNLVLAGQDVFSPSVVNASVGGYMGACAAFPQQVFSRFKELFPPKS